MDLPLFKLENPFYHPRDEEGTQTKDQAKAGSWVFTRHGWSFRVWFKGGVNTKRGNIKFLPFWNGNTSQKASAVNMIEPIPSFFLGHSINTTQKFPAVLVAISSSLQNFRS